MIVNVVFTVGVISDEYVWSYEIQEKQESKFDVSQRLILEYLEDNGGRAKKKSMRDYVRSNGGYKSDDDVQYVMRSMRKSNLLSYDDTSHYVVITPTKPKWNLIILYNVLV